MRKINLNTSQLTGKKISNVIKKTSNKFLVTQESKDLFLIITEVSSIEDLSSIEDNQRKKYEHHLVISHLKDEENVRWLLGEKNIENIIGVNTGDFEGELLFFLEGISSRQKTKDKEQLLPSVINNNKNVDQEIERSISQLDWTDFFDSPVQFLSSIANELIMNAIFNAPHSEKGKALYKEERRDELIHLNKGEEVRFDIRQDDNAITIVVKDNFGRINFEKIKEKLLRSIEEKSPQKGTMGAGLGLYLVYQYSNLVAFRVLPDHSTEIICKIEKNKRYKHYRERITSFFYIEGEQNE